MGKGPIPDSSLPEIRYPHIDPIKIRDRSRLPHWEYDGGAYSITFRLADSLPKAILDRLMIEREAAIRSIQRSGREPTDMEREDLKRIFNEKIDIYLDAGAGACHLETPAIAEMIVDTLKHFHDQRHYLIAWCVMPNHVHVIFHPMAGFTLDEITHSWKSFSANKANAVLRRKGTFWQHESYDHLLRNPEYLMRSIDYVLNNPKKANLTNWPWVGSIFDD
jgi:REP element-mobilizing transposase RayT